MMINEGKRKNPSPESLPRQAVPVLGRSKAICPAAEKIRKVACSDFSVLSEARPTDGFYCHPSVFGGKKLK